MSKISCFRDLLEENAYRLTDRRSMFDYIPFILKEEEARMRAEIQDTHLSVIFDGTCRQGEALAILVRFVSSAWTLEQRLIRLQMLTKSMTGEEIARELISVLSATYGVKSDVLLGAMHDRASVNSVAMRTLKIVFPLIMDIGCFSHTIDHVGDNFKTPVLSEFTSAWIALFSHSPKVRLLWRSQTGRSMPTYSATRWWSRWEVMKAMMVTFGDIEPFLLQNADVGPNLRPKLLSFFSDSQKRATLQIELAAIVDWGEPFVKACYFLEGDGPLALECYEAMEKVSTFLRIAHAPNVRAVAQVVSGAPPTDPRHVQWVDYANKCVKPGLDYFQRQLGSSLKDPLAAFKSARLFHPSKAYVMQPDAAAIDELCSIPFLNFPATLDALKQELPTYLARAAGVDPKFSALEWWRQNAGDLPHWSSAAKKLLLIQPSSAAAERVFSLLKASFNEQQDNSLQDYIESSLMLQYNNR